MIGQAVAMLGAFLMMLAGIGVLRFGDPLARLHALTKATTLGVVLVFLGAAMFLDRPNDWTSLLLAAVLQLLTSPIAAGLISRSTFLELKDATVILGDDEDEDDPSSPRGT